MTCPARGACTHHFIYEEPNGPTSTGTCKLCGDVREASNSLHRPLYHQHRVKGLVAARQAKKKNIQASRILA